jgi:DNA-binding GntR family transcriptional regulator
MQFTTSMRVPQQILERIRAEYLEMPGMTLKADQVARLCGLDRTLCLAALQALVDAKFLSIKADGAYVYGSHH